MADKIASLPGLVNSPHAAVKARKNSFTKAASTMKSFTESKDHMKIKFAKMAHTADYKRSQADLVAKYDTNGDGNFDRNEVLAICHDVAFKSFVEMENVAGAQRMAEASNTT